MIDDIFLQLLKIAGYIGGLFCVMIVLIGLGMLLYDLGYEIIWDIKYAIRKRKNGNKD